MPVPPAVDVTRSQRVPRWLEVGAAYAWRLLVVAAVVVALLELVSRLLVVVLPVAAAVLLARALRPVSRGLGRFLPDGLAAGLAVLGFLVVLGGLFVVVGLLVADELGDLGPTLDRGLRRLEDWVADRGLFGLDRTDVARIRTDAGDAARGLLSSSSGRAAAGARTLGEFAVGAILCLVVTFFILKDGARAVRRTRRLVPIAHRDRAVRMAERAWETLGGYLRGAALLGLVEGVAIAGTMLVVGARLELVVFVLTFVGAFVPMVGAVAAVALLVQQLDNDLLAPVVYGRALSLHPLTVLLGIAAGSALFGLVGTFLAVPLIAVTVNAWDEARLEPDPVDLGVATTEPASADDAD